MFAGSLVLASSVPLVSPDEGRNAEVAREMSASGDFLIPRLAGMPYLDKPPALFWAQALAIRVLGRTRMAVRLPAALAAFGTLVLVAWLARRRAGSAFALRVLALLAAAPLFAVLSAYVIFDMPLTLCVTAVWIGVAEELASGPHLARRAAMFAAVTAGVLLKGPVMFAWAAGGSLGAALMLRSRAPLAWLGWLPGWVLVFGVAGGWFAMATHRYPEYPHYALLEESVERMSTGAFHRDQPWWFAPVVLAAGALPWSLATPWGKGLGRESRVALGFVLFAVIFFTLSRSKLVTYLLPAFPPLAWIAAEAWSDARGSRRGAVIVTILYAALVACLAWPAGLLAGIRDPALRAASAHATRRLVVGFGIAALFGAAAARSRRGDLALAATVAFTPLLLILGGPALMRHAAHESGEPLARAIEAAGGGRVRYESCYSPGTDFVLGRRSEVVSRDGIETTSTYQTRYRAALERRGVWTLLDPASPARGAEVVVRSAGNPAPPPAGRVEFYRDAHFVAYIAPHGSRRPER